MYENLKSSQNRFKYKISKSTANVYHQYRPTLERLLWLPYVCAALKKTTTLTYKTCYNKVYVAISKLFHCAVKMGNV